MTNRFYIADTHFGHAAILNFKTEDGKPVRSFASVQEMDGVMVERWNSVVKAADTVYHLGDICMSEKSLVLLRALNGRKILIKGNHDQAKLSKYVNLFADVRAYDRKDGIICSHIPIHPDSVERFGVNVHGHLHTRRLNDPRYFCVCVEQIDYTPIEYSELMKRIKKGQNESTRHQD